MRRVFRDLDRDEELQEAKPLISDVPRDSCDGSSESMDEGFRREKMEKMEGLCLSLSECLF